MLTAVNNKVDELIQYFKLTFLLHVKNFAALMAEVYLSIENVQHAIKSQHLLDNLVLMFTWIGTLQIVFKDLWLLPKMVIASLDL